MRISPKFSTTSCTVHICIFNFQPTFGLFSSVTPHTYTCSYYQLISATPNLKMSLFSLPSVVQTADIRIVNCYYSVTCVNVVKKPEVL